MGEAAAIDDGIISDTLGRGQSPSMVGIDWSCLFGVIKSKLEERNGGVEEVLFIRSASVILLSVQLLFLTSCRFCD